MFCYLYISICILSIVYFICWQCFCFYKYKCLFSPTSDLNWNVYRKICIFNFPTACLVYEMPYYRVYIYKHSKFTLKYRKCRLKMPQESNHYIEDYHEKITIKSKSFRLFKCFKYIFESFKYMFKYICKYWLGSFK